MSLKRNEVIFKSNILAAPEYVVQSVYSFYICSLRSVLHFCI